jgi:hypothetical protein
VRSVREPGRLQYGHGRAGRRVPGVGFAVRPEPGAAPARRALEGPGPPGPARAGRTRSRTPGCQAVRRSGRTASAGGRCRLGRRGPDRPDFAPACHQGRFGVRGRPRRMHQAGTLPRANIRTHRRTNPGRSNGIRFRRSWPPRLATSRGWRPGEPFFEARTARDKTPCGRTRPSGRWPWGILLVRRWDGDGPNRVTARPGCRAAG